MARSAYQHGARRLVHDSDVFPEERVDVDLDIDWRGLALGIALGRGLGLGIALGLALGPGAELGHASRLLARRRCLLDDDCRALAFLDLLDGLLEPPILDALNPLGLRLA